jgi:hypothetical protein
MMRRIRILTAIAALSIMTVGGAAAQAETNTVPGNPIPLLKILAKPDKTKTGIHGKRVGKRMGKTHMAAKTRVLHRSARARPAAPTPADDDAVPTNVAAVPSAAPPAPPTAASPPSAVASFAEPMPNELVVGGRTVQVTAPDDVNQIDEAADPQRVAASAATAAGRLSDGAEAEPASETATVARAQPERSPVGSASWIMQILAALGGAFAAGSAAWFLIGSAPQRTYG